MPEKEKEEKPAEEEEGKLGLGELSPDEIGDIDLDKLIKIALVKGEDLDKVTDLMLAKKAIESGVDIGKYFLLREIMK